MHEIVTVEKPLLRVEYDFERPEEYNLKVDQNKATEFFLSNGLSKDALRTLTLRLTDKEMEDFMSPSEYNPTDRIISLNCDDYYPHGPNPNEAFLKEGCRALDDILPNEYLESIKHKILKLLPYSGVGFLSIATHLFVSRSAPEFFAVGLGVFGVTEIVAGYYFDSKGFNARLGRLEEGAQDPKWKNIITIDSQIPVNS